MCEWDDYLNLSNGELQRRIAYDLHLARQPGLHSLMVHEVMNDMFNCEAELKKRV